MAKTGKRSSSLEFDPSEPPPQSLFRDGPVQVVYYQEEQYSDQHTEFYHHTYVTTRYEKNFLPSY